MWLSISSARGTELGTGGELIPFPCQGTMENTALTSLMNGQPSMEAGDAAVKGKLEFAKGKDGLQGIFHPCLAMPPVDPRYSQNKMTQRNLVISRPN